MTWMIETGGNLLGFLLGFKTILSSGPATEIDIDDVGLLYFLLFVHF